MPDDGQNTTTTTTQTLPVNTSIINMSTLSRCLNRLPVIRSSVGRSSAIESLFQNHRPRFINVDADRVSPLSGSTNNKRNQRHRSKNNKNSSPSSSTGKGGKGRQSYRFVDRTRVKASGGTGGNGSLSMYNIGRKHKSRPDGGHGGHGGSVIIVADPNEQSLRWTQPHVLGKDGAHGQSQQMHGRNGKNTVLRVPCGVVVRRVLEVDEYWCEDTRQVKKLVPTVVGVAGDDIDGVLDSLPDHWDDSTSSNNHRHHEHSSATGGYLASNDYDSDDDDYDEEFDHDDDYDYYNDNIPVSPDLLSYTAWGDQEKVDIADLDVPGSHVIVARGGRGGFGSSKFASQHGPKPPAEVLARYAKPKPGETVRLELELKLIADIGLVGFPNAGKSSLLAATSRATPHIAPYPFTTLNPLVGHIEYRDGFRVVMCDVPGLISGASEGRGQGTDFLRHLERTKALLYVVDAAGVDGRDPATDFESLVREISQYANGDMLDRKCLVVANKVDLLHQEEREAVEDKLRVMSREAGLILEQDVFGISAGVTGEGLSHLTKSVRQIVMNTTH
jgi:GTPase